MEKTYNEYEVKDKDDAVKSPQHYKLKGLDIEVIDIIRAVTSDLVGYKALCRGNALKYLCRAGHKDNTIQDLKKCKQRTGMPFPLLEIRI